MTDRTTRTIKGLVVAAPASGSGKTTVALGLMAALTARGHTVAPFKVGPDFIDPGHHRAVTGRASRNLDGWMLSRQANQDIFAAGTLGADIAVVEGVMGLFDGYDGRTEDGSTAQMAKWLGLPVLLVVDARSMARSMAALVLGFETFDPDLVLAGVLANNVGSHRHLEYLIQAVKGRTKTSLLGGLPKDAVAPMPERHLGLVTAEDHALDPSAVSDLARAVEQSIEVDRLLEALPRITVTRADTGPENMPGPRPRIGVAKDAAFCFYYPENLDALERAGADLVFFSPLSDPGLPPELSGLYLGGGYPELFAQRISSNAWFLEKVREASQAGMPIYAECGGFMVLCRNLKDLGGEHHPMAGVFDLSTAMEQNRSALGYREVRFARNTPLGPAGTVARGHEFHYSRLADPVPETADAYEATSRAGRSATAFGLIQNQTLGSYVHLHFASNHGLADHFVNACRAWKRAPEHIPDDTAGTG